MANLPRPPGEEGPPREFAETLPPRDPRGPEIVLVEIAKIQADGQYLRRDVNEMRSDVKEVRDRLAKLETKVDHLPGKGFIVAAVIATLTIVGGFITVAPKLQALIQQPAQPAQPPS
jgi:hypothetical protein